MNSKRIHLVIITVSLPALGKAQDHKLRGSKSVGINLVIFDWLVSSDIVGKLIWKWYR